MLILPSSLYENQVTSTVRTQKSTIVKVKTPPLNKRVSIQKPFPSPVDWRDYPIYFVLIDRFNNPNSPPKTQWDKAANNAQGGTFEGVRQKLSYIKNLGAGAIWLSPVLKNVQFQKEYNYHGYGIMDFLEIDPKFGTTPENAGAEFDALINEAHARGLYVILDIVLNHAGDIFAYDVDNQIWNDAPWKDTPYGKIYWRDENGLPNEDWTEPPSSLKTAEGIWPKEFQNNQWFRRQGKERPNIETTQGDFGSLKEFRTDLSDYYGDKPVQNLLIRAYQYIIARYDIDGFRIDTIKHIERPFALTFSNAIRELAFSIGKKNFFIFGEAKSNDEKLLAAYTGRFTSETEEMIGADAVLDFPLRDNLVLASKGFASPMAVKGVFDVRKKVYEERPVMSTHGEASRFFVTFLDNHDDYNRFYYPKYGGEYTHQITMALGLLYCLQGIPCIYYGTEQGLKGTQELYDSNYDSKNGRYEYVREALWGKPNSFTEDNDLYKQIQAIAELRRDESVLRYGRQYFRQVSGNNVDFGYSKELGGIIAFSRILNDKEVVIAANTSTTNPWSGWIVVDNRINNDNTTFRIIYSNVGTTGSSNIVGKEAMFEMDNGFFSNGWSRRLQVNLAPTEIQIHKNS